MPVCEADQRAENLLRISKHAVKNLNMLNTFGLCYVRMKENIIPYTDINAQHVTISESVVFSFIVTS